MSALDMDRTVDPSLPSWNRRGDRGTRPERDSVGLAEIPVDPELVTVRGLRVSHLTLAAIGAARREETT